MAKKVSDLQYAESKHQYTNPANGERYPSVTAIVGSFDSGDKLGAGAAAAVNLWKKGQNHREVWKAKADLGTRIHGYAELWMDGRPAEVPEGEGPYMDAFAQFCDDYHPRWIEVERAVISAFGYGGRFDMIGELDLWDGPKYVLCDIKSGKKYSAEVTLQLAGYRYADGMILYDDKGMAVGLEPMPHIDECAGLYLHDDGTYDLAIVQADLVAHSHLVDLLMLKLWAKEQG